MKIACTTIYDPHDPQAFGGRGYFMTRALVDLASIAYIGPLSTTKFARRIDLKQRLYRRFTKLKYHPYRDRDILKHFACQIAQRLKHVNVDVILSPMSPGSQPIAYLDAKKPIAIWTDVTLAEAIKLYPELGVHRMARESIRDGLANEAAALRNAELVIYTSEYAAQTAMGHYGLDPAKVKVAPFGADLKDDLTPQQLELFLQARPPDVCRLLFLGTSWRRKGGDTALAVATELDRRGVAVELTVVGPKPQIPTPQPDFVKATGFIKKNTPDGAHQWRRLMAESHFLLLPAKADLTPLILSEACAYGLPCLATAVGGIPTIIKPDRNGRTFPLDAPVAAYCDYIQETFANQERYQELARFTYDEYRTRLNWSAIGRSVIGYLSELV